MKQLTGMTIIILSSFAFCTGICIAAPDSFEIDLKELPPAKAQHRTRQRAEVPERKTPPETGQSKGSSIYTVRPGDHLFLILIRSYGLSNNAAEQLIPEVMRLNDIRNTHGLTVGQRLTIPLPPPQERPTREAREKKPEARPAPVQAARPQTVQTPTSEPSTAQSQPHPAQPAAEANMRRVTVPASPPCTLARAIVEQLGLLAPPKKPQPNEESFTASNAGLTVVVACGLSLDEAYTYERLLEQQKTQLIVFSGKEPCRRVIESLSNRLGLSYKPSDPDAVRDLPLTYIISAIGPDGQDVRLTIAPADH